MNLPKSNHRLKSPKGQIEIVFLLVLVVAGAIGLSVAARTITDIKISTTSDESNRAYFAAESGVEEALRRLQSGSPAGPLSLDFSSLNNTTANVVVRSAPIDDFVFPNSFKKDEVGQIILVSDANPDGIIDNSDITHVPTGLWGGSSLTIYWGANAAVEVSVVYQNGTTYTISKTAFDPDDPPSGRRASNSFCADDTSDGRGGFVQGKSFPYKATISLSGGENCNALNNGGGRPVLARVRFLYNSGSPSDLAVVGKDAAGNVIPIPAQSHVIESTGRTVSGVTRKLEVHRLFPSLPGIFDYVLFNGGNDPLEKN